MVRSVRSLLSIFNTHSYQYSNTNTQTSTGTENLGDAKINMELPHTPNEAWRAVPQHVVEDAFDLLICIGRERGQLFDSVSMDPVMNFLVLFLTRPKYIQSPHLRAKFGELLFSVFLPNENQSKNPLSKPSVQCGLLLSSHHLACKHLASGLMRLYGDVEHTGFYEKMNNRFKIALVLKHLWHLESHRPAFLKLAKDEKSFEIFANGVVNHTSDLVTTALSKLPEIRTWCPSNITVSLTRV